MMFCLDSCCLVTFSGLLVFVWSFLFIGVMTYECQAGFELMTWWLLCALANGATREPLFIPVWGTSEPGPQ